MIFYSFILVNYYNFCAQMFEVSVANKKTPATLSTVLVYSNSLYQLELIKRIALLTLYFLTDCHVSDISNVHTHFKQSNLHHILNNKKILPLCAWL